MTFSTRRFRRKNPIAVKTSNRVIELAIEGKKMVSVDMGTPELEPKKIPFEAHEKAMVYAIDVDGHSYDIAAVSMGNPHAVLKVEDIETAPVAELGAKIESHSRFPNRVNVGFMQIVSDSEINLRVYERGVGETQACGTGTCERGFGVIQMVKANSRDVTRPSQGPVA